MDRFPRAVAGRRRWASESPLDEACQGVQRPVWRQTVRERHHLIAQVAQGPRPLRVGCQVSFVTALIIVGEDGRISCW